MLTAEQVAVITAFAVVARTGLSLARVSVPLVERSEERRSEEYPSTVRSQGAASLLP
jgi:hypothetical protein